MHILHALGAFSVWAALCEKVPNVLSRRHTKKMSGAPGPAPPSFGMTPTFPKKKKKRKRKIRKKKKKLKIFKKKKFLKKNYKNSFSNQNKGRGGPATPAIIRYEDDTGR